MHEFRPYPKVEPPPQPAASTLVKKKRQRAELHHGDPFRPLYVYEMLSKISSTLSTKVSPENRQILNLYVFMVTVIAKLRTGHYVLYTDLQF